MYDKQDSVLFSSHNFHFLPISTFLPNFRGEKNPLDNFLWWLRLHVFLFIREKPEDKSDQGNIFLIVWHLSSSHSSRVFQTFGPLVPHPWLELWFSIEKNSWKLTTEKIINNWVRSTIGIDKPVWKCKPGIYSLSVFGVGKHPKYSVRKQ